ncbi:MAG: hypothetical protein FWG73_06075 [Planctomycetaceae bacterium]|nr:hypothetical protein [Planctomycetaceae bacterium]
MKRIGLSLCSWTLLGCVAVLPTGQYALAQQFTNPKQTQQQTQPGAIFHAPMQTSNISFSSGFVTPVGSTQSRPAPVVTPMLPAASGQAVRPVVHNGPLQNGPVQNGAVQGPVTQSHRLRLAPQNFERNLVGKLGSRFVPIRNVESPPGQSRYQLPGRNGAAIELLIDHQHATVSVAGPPQLVNATLQIVRFLDIEDIPGAALTQFVPVQQANVEPARRVAGLVNQEMHRVAQIDARAAGNAANINGAAGDEAFGRVVGNVHIDIIDALGTVVIQGSPSDVAVVQEMIRQLEELGLANEPVIELVPMQHADSLRINQLVQTLYQQVYLQRRGQITMIPLVKPNTILLIGRQESITAAKELIAKLDTPVIPNANFRIFHLKHAAATELGPQIQNSITGRPGAGQQLAPQVGIIPDARTNSLIVQANPRDMLEIESMIRQMDVPGGEITSFMSVFTLRNAMATEMQQVLSNALNSGISNVRGTMLSLNNVDAEGNLMRSSVAYNVSVVADARNNALIVTAPPETMPLIAALIEQLDRLPSAESRIRVFTLFNGDAFALTTLLNNVFASGAATQVMAARPGFEEGDSPLVGIRFQTDVRTNSIVAIGSEGDLAIAEALLIRLDSENLNNRRVFTMKLVNTPAEEIAPILNTHIANERQIALQNTQTLLPNSPLEQYERETNIIAEPISNSLIVSTSPRQFEQIRKIITELDERPMMVAIEVLIAEVSINRSRDRGVEFGLQDSILFDRAMNTVLPGASAPPFPSIIAANPITGGLTNTKNVGSQGVTSLGVGQGSGFSFSASSESVSIFVRALETQSRTQVLGRPRLVTLHNRRAQIVVGEEVPYEGMTTVGTGGTSSDVARLPIGTTLDITPRIMPDGMVSMAVFIERSSLIDMLDIGNRNAPHTRTTNATTTLNAMDGQTVVFAGLISETKRSVNNSIPGLNRIPILKHFFEMDTRTNDRSELLIVLTPRILRTQDDMNALDQQEFERMRWCTADVVRLTGNPNIRRRSDVWSMHEVPHIPATPIRLKDTQLPPVPVFPVPVIETR